MVWHDEYVLGFLALIVIVWALSRIERAITDHQIVIKTGLQNDVSRIRDDVSRMEDLAFQIRGDLAEIKSLMDAQEAKRQERLSHF